ncbi:MAG: FHA domain-containing protein [Deltaproteobacteria bacterium]|nr:FHA domain-containing protein [Deltaproteobacteria bacterium]
MTYWLSTSSTQAERAAGQSPAEAGGTAPPARDPRPGARVAVSSGGVLIGRAPDCDIVLTDERASRRHALVHMAGDEPRVVRLGKGRTEVGGEQVESERALAADDLIALPGLELTLVHEDDAPPTEDDWVLRKLDGGVFGVSSSPYTVGGGDDALRIDGWPPRALTFWRTGSGLSVELGTDARIDGEALAGGHVATCASGARIEVGGETIQVLAFGGMLASTVADESTDRRPRAVRLAFLPRGARLYVDGCAAYLPERRAELLSLLLAPPEPHRPGELIPDDVVLERLWPRQTKTTNDIHVLVHRIRKSLVSAGIDGAALVERDSRAGGTRFVLHPEASAAVE